MIKMRKKGKEDMGQTLICNIPNVISDIPVIILFRALGFVSDREILQYICYDKTDK
jgi:DNA-directed RNA polymerase II subunit RPB2